MEFDKNIFIHHVFFWLKQPGNGQDLAALVAGLEKLSVVETIHSFHIGHPAGTARDVVDSTYAVSWLLYFRNREDHDHYQVDPAHLEFIDTCSGLWNRVQVYDTVGV